MQNRTRCCCKLHRSWNESGHIPRGCPHHNGGQQRGAGWLSDTWPVLPLAQLNRTSTCTQTVCLQWAALVVFITWITLNYNPEEFCISLVKGCLEVKSISILCFSGTSKEVMVPSWHLSILWEAGRFACATDLHLPLKGSSHNCVVQFC